MRCNDNIKKLNLAYRKEYCEKNNSSNKKKKNKKEFKFVLSFFTYPIKNLAMANFLKDFFFYMRKVKVEFEVNGHGDFSV